jgi:hypothetical protein
MLVARFDKITMRHQSIVRIFLLRLLRHVRYVDLVDASVQSMGSKKEGPGSDVAAQFHTRGLCAAQRVTGHLTSPLSDQRNPSCGQ